MQILQRKVANLVSKAWDQGQASTVSNLAGFQRQFHIDSGTDAKAIRNFVSLVYVGDGFGAALSYFLNDRLGRRWSLRVYIMVYIIGQLIAVFAPNVGALYASRIVTGLGIGSLSATAPMTIAEIAPAEIRGMLTSWYTVVMALSLLVVNFCVYGVNKHIEASQLQYRIVWFAPCIWMGVLALISFFVCESPRWLLLKGRRDEALFTLIKLRGLPGTHPRIRDEINGIELEIIQSRELFADSGRSSAHLYSVARETFTVPENLRRVQQALILFALPQLSGANAITTYLVPILKIVGASGDAARNIFLSGMYSLAKFFFTLMASLVFIDMLGRRKSLFIGITTQLCTDLYVGIYVQRKQAGVDVTGAASKAALAAIYIHGFAYAVGKSLFEEPFSPK